MNQKRYWLRWGIIMIVILVIIFGLSAFQNNIFGPAAGALLILLPISIADGILYSIVGVHVLGTPNYWFIDPTIVGYIFVFVLYFLIGALLGGIIGKLKNRNKIVL